MCVCVSGDEGISIAGEFVSINSAGRVNILIVMRRGCFNYKWDENCDGQKN